MITSPTLHLLLLYTSLLLLLLLLINAHHFQLSFQQQQQYPTTFHSSNPILQNSRNPERILTEITSNSFNSTNSTQQTTLKSPVISRNSTIRSENGVFELGFFTVNGGSKWYLGIWYASIPIKTYIWVANRQTPLTNPIASAQLSLDTGRLSIVNEHHLLVWQSENSESANEAKLLDTGNLVLVSGKEGSKIVWQSFDYPTDSWLPLMNITQFMRIICWRSYSDPSPGNYALRLEPSDFGEFDLVFNDTEIYWSTGKWDGNTFTNVPEMTVAYIYNFFFTNPFTPSASFMYTENTRENYDALPLTRFAVDSNGQFKQYTWSPQSEHWTTFWSQPDNPCRVYGLCGNFGFCTGSTLRPCQCMNGFRPVDYSAWGSGDYNGGCQRDGESICEESDGFEEIGVVGFDFDRISRVSFDGSRSLCEESCLKNCSCLGLNYNEKSGLCKNLFGSLLNLRYLTSDSTEEEVLYVRTASSAESMTSKRKKKKRRLLVIIVGVSGLLLVLGFVILALFVLRKRKMRKKEQEFVFPALNLKVFSYKLLYTATRGFSEKLGHGGFGAVFRGELSDSSQVAVKRLERPGGGGGRDGGGGRGEGEKEFRAEVCTIGNIQHVNLVRLRGFCCENSHRLLVYDYMQNGPLSRYLQPDACRLSWDVRFRVALGTARGVAYLHEACRDCIIHCDIKPENILLDEEFIAKVSDFGMAKLIGREFSRVLTTMRGTLGYVAPEWISGVAITPKADVYSYGMTLLELIGGRRNVETPTSAGTSGAEKWFFPPWAARQIIEGNIEQVVDNRLVGAYDPVEVKRVGLVAVWCIQDDESARPTMGTVVKMLEGTVDITLPPPPKLLQALVSGDSFHGVGVTSQEQDVSTGATCSVESNQVSGIVSP